MKKKEIRHSVLAQRAALTRSEYWQLNDDLLTQFQKFDWGKLKCLHTFLPISENKEVDTFELLSYFRENHPQLKIAVGRSDFKSKTITPVLFDYENTVLVKNKYHIPEPLYGTNCTLEEIDAVLCPLLAFDSLGNRVGYGAGFYDKFLATCNPNVLKIGLSFFPCLNLIEDVNSLDIKLSHCITPKQIHTF